MRCLLPLGPLCSIALFGLILTAGLRAQTLGTVTGEVKDSTGAVIPGATITVRNTGTNVPRSVTTNDDGIYNVPALNPGTYEVRVERRGFKSASRTNIAVPSSTGSSERRGSCVTCAAG